MRRVSVGGLALVSIAAQAGNVFTTDYAEGSAQQEAAREEASRLTAKDRADRIAVDEKSRWSRIDFTDRVEGFGDADITPFGDNVEYKINAMNYNIYLSDMIKVPFQLYYGALASNEAPEKTNEGALLDPTQGVAAQFPVAFRFRGNKVGGLCHFEALKGYCVAGGDVTVRGVRLSELNEAGDVEESLIFGASAGLRASVLFPIFEAGVPGDTGQAGHLSASIGGRYYYHDTDDQGLLFGEITDPIGATVTFDKEFGALSAESEIDIYKYFKIRIEYFYPLSNRDVLGDVFKASFVFAPK